MKVRSLSH